MKRRLVLGCSIALLLGTGVVVKAGIRAAGKYCGVVIFDRWDGCTLYSGSYVMYVSEKTKEDLRKYAGQPVRIGAKEVYQPINPGDGRIGKCEYLGPAPNKRGFLKLEFIHLQSSTRVRKDGKAVATMTIRNKGKAPVTLYSPELALTLLMKRPVSKQSWSVADGPSFALITRQSFGTVFRTAIWQGKGIVEGNPFSWSIGEESALPYQFSVSPGKQKRIDVLFDLPDGQYDFLFGYGGGVHDEMCLASRLSAFDVKDGKAKTVEIKGR